MPKVLQEVKLLKSKGGLFLQNKELPDFSFSTLLANFV
jgi:hypothetical protein